MFQNKTLSLVFKSTKWDIHSYGLPSFSPYSQVEGPGYSWGESSDIVSKPVKKTTSPMLCFPFFGVCISVALLWASCWQGQLASCGVIVCSVFLKAIPLAKWGTRASLCLTDSFSVFHQWLFPQPDGYHQHWNSQLCYSGLFLNHRILNTKGGFPKQQCIDLCPWSPGKPMRILPASILLDRNGARSCWGCSSCLRKRKMPDHPGLIWTMKFFSELLEYACQLTEAVITLGRLGISSS